jgi:hypothetical protein
MEDSVHIVAQSVAHSRAYGGWPARVLCSMCNDRLQLCEGPASRQFGRIGLIRPIDASLSAAIRNPVCARFGGWRHRAAFPVHHIRGKVLAVLAKIAVGNNRARCWIPSGFNLSPSGA